MLSEGDAQDRKDCEWRQVGLVGPVSIAASRALVEASCPRLWAAWQPCRGRCGSRIPATRKTLEVEPVAFGAELARFLRFNTPGSNLWYARLGLNRLVQDQLQTMLDPDYRGCLRRMELKARRDYPQQFWWQPGKASPRRAPSLGAAIPK